MSKFIGTIIDKSYFDMWEEGENLYKMCMSCDKPRLLRDKGGLTRGGKHYCEDNKYYWTYAVQLDRDGFMFILAKESTK